MSVLSAASIRLERLISAMESHEQAAFGPQGGLSGPNPQAAFAHATGNELAFASSRLENEMRSLRESIRSVAFREAILDAGGLRQRRADLFARREQADLDREVRNARTYLTSLQRPGVAQARAAGEEERSLIHSQRGQLMAEARLAHLQANPTQLAEQVSARAARELAENKIQGLTSEELIRQRSAGMPGRQTAISDVTVSRFNAMTESMLRMQSRVIAREQAETPEGRTQIRAERHLAVLDAVDRQYDDRINRLGSLKTQARINEALAAERDTPTALRQDRLARRHGARIAAQDFDTESWEARQAGAARGTREGMASLDREALRVREREVEALTSLRDALRAQERMAATSGYQGLERDRMRLSLANERREARLSADEYARQAEALERPGMRRRYLRRSEAIDERDLSRGERDLGQRRLDLEHRRSPEGIAADIEKLGQHRQNRLIDAQNRLLDSQRRVDVARSPQGAQQQKEMALRQRQIESTERLARQLENLNTYGGIRGRLVNFGQTMQESGLRGGETMAALGKAPKATVAALALSAVGAVLGKIKEETFQGMTELSPNLESRLQKTIQLHRMETHGRKWIGTKGNVTDWLQDKLLGRRLASVEGLPPATYQSIEQYSSQFGLRTMQLGGNTLEAAIANLQMQFLDPMLRIMDSVDRKLPHGIPAFS